MNRNPDLSGSLQRSHKVASAVSLIVKSSIGAAIAAAALHGSLAFAQSAPAEADRDASQLEEVVVTANYRGERLQSVGSSIGVLGAEDLASRNITEFMDIARNMPGLNVIDAGPGQKKIFIRGLTGAGESTVGLYYDGMPTTGSGESAAEAGGRQTDLYVFDAERVEVLRGPQSSLYGSSALAGVVRVLTKQADVTRTEQQVVVDGATTASGSESYALKGVINLPLVSDRFAVRLAAYKAHDGGFIDNSYLNLKDVNDSDQLGARVNAKLVVSDRGTLTAQFFSQNLEVGDQGVERPFDSLIGVTPWPAAGPLTNDARSRQPRRDSTQMAGLNYVHEFDGLTLTVAQSHFDRDNKDDQDLSGLPYFFSFLQSIDEFPPVDVIPQGVFESRQKTRMNTSEVRVVTSSPGPWHGVLGLLYQNRKVDIDNQFLQTDAGTGLVDPSVPSWYHRVADFKLTQKAVYGELTYDFNDKWSATVGGRAFRNERTDHAHGIVGFMRLGGLTPVTTLTASESKAIYKAALNYKYSDSLLGYVSMTEGYRAGGTVNQVVPELPPAYGPDYTRNYEAGMKSEWLDHRLQLNVAAYHIAWYDMQYSGDFFNGVFSGVLNCKGKCAHSNGVEVDVTARPMRGLDLNLATTVMKAELDKALPEANGSPVSGTQLANTPTFTLAASANYGWEVNTALRASVHADLQHVGKVANMTYRQNLNIPGPAYTLLNASTTLASIDDAWELRLYARNLTNKRAQVTTQNDTVTPTWVYVNRPRTIGLEVTLRGN